MSPVISIELTELFADLADLRREVQYEFRQRRNERLLKSRNKREGWYVHSKGKFCRMKDKRFALRYRKQTGAQVLIVKRLK